MAIASIPEYIKDFNMYNAGNKLVGLTDEVKLPSFEQISESISGSGILGEIDSPSVGAFGSIEQEIGFRIACDDEFNLLDSTGGASLTLRSSNQHMDPNGGGAIYQGMRVVVRGKVKKLDLGTLKQNTKMDSKIVLELTYILIEIDSKPRVELDKLNYVYKVNGVDLLEQVRSQC